MGRVDICCFQADQDRAERQRQYLAQLAEEAEYESSEPTSLATSTMEGEHLIAGEREEEEDSTNNTSTPQDCLSPEMDTPTPTHCPPSFNHVDRIRDSQVSQHRQTSTDL